MSGIDFLAELERIIDDRLAGADEQSYTVRLARQGVDRIAQKIGEEGVEVALAAVSKGREPLLDEAADLLYHLLVLLQVRGLSLHDVAEVLEQRHRDQ
jgi:phosphoribosyl-ATP pyrophosphohydrolase/phosphoribosyl-AMP cyclohydrolase